MTPPDQTRFVATEDQWDTFVDMLENPPADNAKFRRLAARTAPWERER